jgi:hypothetical protein
MLDKSYIDFDILWSWRIQNKLSQGEKTAILRNLYLWLTQEDASCPLLQLTNIRVPNVSKT